jgi:hypothetical protein
MHAADYVILQHPARRANNAVRLPFTTSGVHGRLHAAAMRLFVNNMLRGEARKKSTRCDGGSCAEWDESHLIVAHPLPLTVCQAGNRGKASQLKSSRASRSSICWQTIFTAACNRSYKHMKSNLHRACNKHSTRCIG